MNSKYKILKYSSNKFQNIDDLISIEEPVQIEQDSEIINHLQNVDEVFETDQDSNQLVLVGASIQLEDNPDDDLLIEDLEEEIAN